MRVNFSEVAVAADLRALLVEALGEPDRSDKWLCPFHDDHHPSLSLTSNGRGYNCWACGAKRDAIDRVVERRGISKLEAARWLVERFHLATSQTQAESGWVDARIALCSYGLGAPVQTWKYQGADGTVVYCVGLLNQADRSKTFRTRHLVGEDWFKGDPPGKLPLYRIPDLVEAIARDMRIYVVKGEECADRIRKLGLPATTSAHGAKCAHKTDWTTLEGAREVVVVPDNDAPGRSYAEAVARILASFPFPPTVKLLSLPVDTEGADVADWLESRPGSRKADEEEERDELERLAFYAPLADLTPSAKKGGPS